MEKKLADCQRVIGYHFANPKLLEIALTHSSLRSPDRECNERLEFLGDSVLGLVITEELYRLLPDQAEGELTRIKSAVVSRGALYRASTELGLARFIAVARGVRRRDELPVSVIANLVESVIGAIYLDAGYFPAREFVIRHLGPELDDTLADRGAKNYKSLLQHEVQDSAGVTPTYRTVDEGGPQHRKHFTVAAVIRGKEWGRAEGATKKDAEQDAARKALEAWSRRGRGRRRRRPGGDDEGGRGGRDEARVEESADEAADSRARSSRRRRRRRGGRGRGRRGEGREASTQDAPAEKAAAADEASSGSGRRRRRRRPGGADEKGRDERDGRAAEGDAEADKGQEAGASRGGRRRRKPEKEAPATSSRRGGSRRKRDDEEAPPKRRRSAPRKAAEEKEKAPVDDAEASAPAAAAEEDGGGFAEGLDVADAGGTRKRAAGRKTGSGRKKPAVKAPARRKAPKPSTSPPPDDDDDGFGAGI